MKTTSKSKSYKGLTFNFRKENGRGYKVTVSGFSQYWYQSTMSVKVAYKHFNS